MTEALAQHLFASLPATAARVLSATEEIRQLAVAVALSVLDISLGTKPIAASAGNAATGFCEHNHSGGAMAQEGAQVTSTKHKYYNVIGFQSLSNTDLCGWCEDAARGGAMRGRLPV